MQMEVEGVCVCVWGGGGGGLSSCLAFALFALSSISLSNFVMAINSSFHEQPQEDGRPQKRESYEPYCIIVYSVAI